MRVILTAILTSFFYIVGAQRHQIYNDRIASLQVVAGTEWLQLPVIKQNSNVPVTISFDELSHVYHRFTYTITHCEADWTTSEEIFRSDYAGGFTEDIIIEDVEESTNTNQLYTHYRFQIPNDNCQLKLSGNYRVDVFDDESRDTMFTARFMLAEDIASCNFDILTDTDIDVRRNHQQLNLRVDYPSSLGVTDPRTQFRVIVMQNLRTDNMVICPPAPILSQNSMTWTHTRQLIFTGTNEYHKFEFLDPHRNSLGVESVKWDGERYNAYLYHDYPRRAYVYDETPKGAFYLRNSDNIENDVTTDYAIVHFFLDTPRLNGDVYLDGQWTQNSLSEQYRMTYNEEEHCYETAIPLKMGYYSYQYVLLRNSNSINEPQQDITTSETEGDFFETHNIYNVFVYFRGNGDRTWRLIGTK